MKNITKRIAVLFALICLFSTVALVCACGNTDDGAADGKVTITYVTGDGASAVPTKTGDPGDRLYEPSDPTRDGYRFDGWLLNGQPFVFDADTVIPQTDITLTAAWKKLYTITFVTGDGASSVSAMQYAEGDELALDVKPTRQNYKFTGWTYNDAAFEMTTMPAQNITLTASWVQGYTITFVTGVNDYSVEPLVEVAGEKITPPVIKRPGYHVVKWKLGSSEYKFDKMPAENITLTAVWETLTNLPAMFIELSNKSGDRVELSTVNRSDYVPSRVTLTNTTDEYRLDYLLAEFRGRGNGSWTDFNGSNDPKNGYRIKFDKKQSLFGGAANKHWVVLACTNFDDPTMSRNYLAYNMGGAVFDNIEHVTSANWIDLYVNGEYRGVYLLCEHTRVGSGRVDIESEYGVNDTGYLIEYDAYAASDDGAKKGVTYFSINDDESEENRLVKYPFTVKSPDPDDYVKDGGLTERQFMDQVSYIKDYVKRVYEAAIGGDFETFAELADVDSFVDMYILHELYKNVDCGYSSFYLYKKPGGKLYAGPPWDFDATTNINERGDRTPQGIYVAGSVADPTASPHCASELYINLYKNASFKGAVKTRWKTLSPNIKAFLDERMNDEVYSTYKSAMGKNYVRWNGKVQSVAESDWISAMQTLKQWLSDRTAWLDTEWLL